MNEFIPEEILDAVCDKFYGLKLLLGVSVAGIGLMLLWLPFAEPGTEPYAVSLMTILLLLPFSLVSGIFVRACRQRQEELEQELSEYQQRRR